jgi:hypothetical protein
MAINIPIISEFQDKGIKAAKAAFANFKTSIAGAEGGMNKFKAGSKSALDAVSANAGAFAVVGAVAFAKFAAAGIKAFQDLALSAGKFADATGLTVEDASRWREVAGDIGVGSDSIQTGINKMNKALGTSPQLFKDLGIEIATTNTGATDVNQTFLNVIDKLKSIKDPAERAKVATQLLGKGWMDMAELIQKGSSSLKGSLAGVSDAQVIDPKELKRAREYRDAQENLGDVFTKLSVAVGESLVPALTTLGEILVWVADKLDTNVGGVNLMDGALTNLSNTWDIWFGSEDNAKTATDKTTNSLWDQATALYKAEPLVWGFVDAVDGMATSLMNADNAWKILTGNLDQEVALDNAKTKVAELEAAAAKAFGSGAQQDIDDYEAKAAEFAGILAVIAGNMDGISSKEILIRFKTQGPAAAVELAYWLSQGAELGGLSQHDLLTMAGLSIPGYASGGSVSGGPILVGEKGPEIFVPGQAGTIIPNNAIGGGNGSTINITVTSADPNAVVRALQSYNRNVGKIPVSVQ